MITHLAATAKGRKLIEQAFPAKSLEAALSKMNFAQGNTLEKTLRTLLGEMQHLHDRRHSPLAIRAALMNIMRRDMSAA